MKRYLPTITIFTIIIGIITLGVWYSDKDSPLKQLAKLDVYSEEELSFLEEQGFLNDIDSENLPSNKEQIVSLLKSPGLIEQNLNSPDESFEVLATKLDNNTYQLAFKLENKSNQSKEFYLIPISESSQTEFKEIKGVVKGGKVSWGNQGDWGYDIEKHKQELRPELAQAYDDIEKNGYTGKPIKLVLEPNSILIAQSKWEIDRGRASDSLEPVYLLVYGSAGGAKDEITILDVHSSPQQGENWEVSFTTRGINDLRIIPNDQATIDDDEFIGLYCNEKERTPQILENDVIYYPNWQCNGIGKVIHYTKKAGKHTLRFEFGGQTAFAYNNPGNVDFTNPAWDEVDEGNDISIGAAKINWTALPPRSAASHVSDSAAHQGISLAGDFTFKFEYQFDNLVGNPILAIGAFEVAGTIQSLIDNSRDAVAFDQYQDRFRVRIRENGVSVDFGEAFSLSAGTTYFLTLDYVVSTKTATLHIHTGAHHPGGSHVDELSATGSAGVTLNDIMALATQDDDSSSGTIDGFIQNLDVGAAEIMNGVVSYWKLDDNLATDVVLDARGSNDGTVVNDESNNSDEQSTATAKIVRAFDLDGTNDYVIIQANGAADMVGGAVGATISAWYYFTDSADGVIYEDAWATNVTRNRITILSDGKIELKVRSTGAEAVDIFTTDNTYSKNAWHHVVGVIDLVANTMLIYVDGDSVDVTGSFDLTEDVFDTDNIMNTDIGGRYDGTEPFDGIIDEVGIWNRALDLDEITELYNGGNGLAYPFTLSSVRIKGGFRVKGGLKVKF